MTRFALLASGLVPALLVVAIRVFSNHRAASAILFVASIFLAVLLARAMRARASTNTLPFVVDSIEDESAQVPAYVVTYVVPFLFLTIESVADLLACVVFVFFVLVLVYRTDLALVNPLLLTVRLHLYQVRAKGGGSFVLVSKERPLTGQAITTIKLADNLYQLSSIED